MADDEKDASAEDAAPVAVYVPFGHAVLCGIGLSVGASACAAVLWSVYIAMRLVMVAAYNLGAER